MKNTSSANEKSNVRVKNGVKTFFGTLVFGMLAFLIFFPVFAGILASFRPGRELIRRGLSLNLDFSDMTLSNYQYLFSGNADSVKYFNWFKNSLLLTIIQVLATLLICYIVAYGLSMYEYKLKNFLFFLVIATMMVPFEILMLPLYQEMITLNLINSTAGVILPVVCSASTIFFFKQYLGGVPKELLDAGRIDGATEYGICFKIIFPITKPAFAAMAILVTMNSWNNILWPMLVYRDPSKFTLPIGLNTLLSPYGNNYDVLISGAMFGILPIFILFIAFQRYFIEGMTAGAVKG